MNKLVTITTTLRDKELMTTHKNSLKIKRKRRFKENLPLLFMFIPVILFYLIFRYVPMLGNIIAFKDYNFSDGMWGSPWVGLENFKLLFSNPQSLKIIKNTLMLGILNLVFGFPFPVIMAILLNEVKKAWFKKNVQTLIYLPHFLSWVIVGGMVITMFSQESGIINHIINKVIGESYPFLYKEVSWVGVYLSSGIWKETGFSAIIYLAALTSIDPSLYEAANIDGANKWQQIWNVTIPGISTTVVLVLIISIGRLIEVGFDQVFVLQNPVVDNVADVISTYIYKVGLNGGRFSLASGMGLFESILAFIMILAANYFARRYEKGLW
jgi:putative aldouronate transport system permease protein